MVSVAPNPYSNTTVISNTQATTVNISITDVQGRILSSTTLTSNEVKEVGAGLSPGLYILRAQSAEERTQVLRLVKGE